MSLDPAVLEGRWVDREKEDLVLGNAQVLEIQKDVEPEVNMMMMMMVVVHDPLPSLEG